MLPPSHTPIGATGTKPPPRLLPRSTEPLPAAIPNRPTILQQEGTPPLSQPTVAPVQLTMAPPVPPTAPRTRAAVLPEGQYFVYDGASQRGPLSRTEFLEGLAGAPDITGWWYWSERMADWQPVETLGEPAPAAYRLAPNRRK